MAGGEMCVKARLAARGCQNPDLKDGNADTFGGASAYAPLISGSPTWSLDIKDACRQVDGGSRDVVLRAPMEGDPADAQCIWKRHAPASGLNDAPAGGVSQVMAKIIVKLRGLARRSRTVSSGLFACPAFVFRSSKRLISLRIRHSY